MQLSCLMDVTEKLNKLEHELQIHQMVIVVEQPQKEEEEYLKRYQQSAHFSPTSIKEQL